MIKSELTQRMEKHLTKFYPMFITNDLYKLLQLIDQIYNQRGDDHCWMDFDLILKEVGLPVKDRKVGCKEAMKKNCDLFIETMCQGGEWKSYQELLQENENLRERLLTFSSILD